jgi:RNA polymerase sigma-70 factor (ECF subfamily)
VDALAYACGMNGSVANDELDDAALARRIASADARSARAAEDALYRRLAPRVRLYGLKHLRDRHAAADLVQHVMMTTIERLRGGKLRNPERLASFVLGMCRMVVLDLRRTYARRERLLETFGDQEAMGEPETTDRLDREKLLRALDTLSERERSVLVMTFYDDRPAAQIAAELDLSEANVRVIRHRALERLRERVLGKGEPR